MPGQQPAIVAGRARLARAESTLLPAVQAAMRTYLGIARAAVLNHDTSGVTAAAVGGPLPPNLDAWPPRTVWTRAVATNILPVGEWLWRDTWNQQLAPDEHATRPEESDEFDEYLTATATRLADAAWPDEVYDRLRQLIVGSIAAGEPLSTLRGRGADLLHLDRWSSRAQFITRNESLNALNSAAYATGLARADLFGDALFKRWLAVPDTSTREAHRLANGQTVAVNQLFDVGGEQLRYPHDPRGSTATTANCRCLLLWVDEQELANESGETALAAAGVQQWEHNWVPLTPLAMAQKSGKSQTRFSIPRVGDPDLEPLPPTEANGNSGAVKNPFYRGQDLEKVWAKDAARDAMHPAFTNAELRKQYLPLVKVDPRELIHTQSWVRPIDPDFAAKASKAHIKEAERGPTVYRSPDGRLYIADGHHRVLMALANGDKTIEVHEYSTERDVPTLKSPRRRASSVSAASTPTEPTTPEGSTTMADDTTATTGAEPDLAADVWGIPTDNEMAAWSLDGDEDQAPAAAAPAQAGGGGVTAADFTPSGGPTAAKRKRAATAGDALPGGRFPVENGADLDKAINAVSLAKGGEAGRRLVRRFIIRQARKLGLESKIPDTWNSDGSLKPTGARPMAAATYADPAPRLSWVERVAANVPMETDPEAFAIPPGPRGTKLHVLNDQGWVAGYIADWQSRHKVYDVPPPRDPYGGGYPKFRRHPVRTSDGARVMTGPITSNGHGDPTEHTMASVIAHYDDPRYVVANVVPTDAEHGIWVAGSLRAGVSPFQVALLDTYSQSGHWMYDELVASCCVSVPAFELPTQVAPVAALAAAAGDRYGRIEEAHPREVLDDTGNRVHLIAAGLVVPDHLEQPAMTASVDAWQLMRDLRAAEADDASVKAAARRMTTDPGVTVAATRMRKGA